MAATRDRIDQQLRAFIAEQPLFFVATAPLGAEGHVNLSPKGYDSFRVLDERTVAYLDLTGSGAETAAHLRENGRITVMFCSFGDRPLILRLFGRGEVLERGTPAFEQLRTEFPDVPGARAVVRVAVERIQTSCGYSVPVMSLTGERATLAEWAAGKDEAELAEYRARKNARSIDGLPALG